MCVSLVAVAVPAGFLTADHELRAGRRCSSVEASIRLRAVDVISEGHLVLGEGPIESLTFSNHARCRRVLRSTFRAAELRGPKLSDQGTELDSVVGGWQPRSDLFRRREQLGINDVAIVRHESGCDVDGSLDGRLSDRSGLSLELAFVDDHCGESRSGSHRMIGSEGGSEGGLNCLDTRVQLSGGHHPTSTAILERRHVVENRPRQPGQGSYGVWQQALAEPIRRQIGLIASNLSHWPDDTAHADRRQT